MSDELVKSLNSRIQELTGENVRRKQRERDALAKLKQAEGRIADLEKAGGDLGKAQDRIKELEQAVKDAEQAVKDAPSRHSEELKTLRADLLSRDRRAAFEKAAKGKVREDALADAFERVEWGDDASIDESKVGAEVDRLIAEKPYLKKGPDGLEPAAGGDGKPTPTPRPPGPASDRGAAPGKAVEITSPTGDAFRIA